MTVQANPRPSTTLLSADDPPPARTINPDGQSPFLLTADHAGKAIPAALGSLGIGENELSRHIGWDIGVGPLGELLARALDAVFIRQSYSRLVIDCNRGLEAPDLIPAVSDGTPVPGNQAITDADRAARLEAIHEPYQQSIAAELGRRAAIGQPTVVVSLHSFTPALLSRDGERPWQIGVLHDRGDTRFALRLLDVLHQAGDLVVGDNEPYQMKGTGHTLPRHVYDPWLPYAELEIRQDLLLTADDQEEWSRRLSGALMEAMSSSG